MTAIPGAVGCGVTVGRVEVLIDPGRGVSFRVVRDEGNASIGQLFRAPQPRHRVGGCPAGVFKGCGAIEHSCSGTASGAACRTISRRSEGMKLVMPGGD